MEQKKILLNPAVSLKNHLNYTNRIYFIEVKNAQKSLKALIGKYKEYLDVIFTFSSFQSDFLYIAAHKKLDVPGTIIYSDKVDKFKIVFPCKEHEKNSERILPQFVLEPEYTQNNLLKWDSKMWEIYYWLKVNFRLFNSEIGKKVDLNPVTVARRKEKMMSSLHVHYPVYADGHNNYTTLFFILEDIPDPKRLQTLLSDLSATSYLIKGSKGTHLCFVWVRQIHAFFAKMKKVIQNNSLGTAHFSSKWTPLLDDYKKGKIEERLFYMFPPRPE